MSKMKSMFIIRNMGTGEGGSPHCRVHTLPANTPNRNDIDRDVKGLSDQSNMKCELLRYDGCKSRDFMNVEEIVRKYFSNLF